MAVTVLSEAGLSECARTDTDCLPGFGMFSFVAVVVGSLAIVWFAAAVTATVAIIDSTLGVTGTVMWILTVWMMPLVGVIAWNLHSRGRYDAPVRHPG